MALQTIAFFLPDGHGRVCVAEWDSATARNLLSCSADQRAKAAGRFPPLPPTSATVVVRHVSESRATQRGPMVAIALCHKTGRREKGEQNQLRQYVAKQLSTLTKLGLITC